MSFSWLSVSSTGTLVNSKTNQQIIRMHYQSLDEMQNILNNSDRASHMELKMFWKKSNSKVWELRPVISDI